jgi:hypothetical protein
MGIPYPRDLNVCLLESWLKRYQLDDGKLWKQVLDAKHNTTRRKIFYGNDMGAS